MSGRVLLISAHFPPDTGAATHRLRLLAPHLPSVGWEPTVLTIAPDPAEATTEPGLLALLPEDLRVIRVRPLSRRLVRVGDAGIRGLPSLARAAGALHEERPFDLAFIAVPSHYVAVLGPYLRARHRLRFILDYSDPWVGAWGRTVGGGPGGAVDWKSVVSRWIGVAAEPVVVAAASGLCGVSDRTLVEVLERNPRAASLPRHVLPIGGSEADFEELRRRPRRNTYFDPGDGLVHACYVGALLPLGLETLRALLTAAARLRDIRPERFARLRLHFFGTSNQTTTTATPRVTPIAAELGVANIVHEVPQRVPYLDALTILTQASAILMLGSSERHYTASKVYPGVLARRPVLAMYHAESSAVEVLRAATRPPSVQLIAYDDVQRACAHVPELTRLLGDLEPAGIFRQEDVDLAAFGAYDAAALARELAGLLDRVAERRQGDR